MTMLTLPGLIDPHVHLRDPGQTHKEDFYTGTSAALAGGFTTIFDMPNNKEPITTAELLKEKIAIAKQKIVCDVGFFFGSTGNNLSEFNKVKNQTRGLKLYLNQTTGRLLLDKNLLESVFNAWPSQSIVLHSSILDAGRRLPILVHAEGETVDQIIKVVRKTRKQTHFCHISLADELKIIIKAKKEGLPVTCGVTPHHLFLTEKDVKKLGPFGKVKAPLRAKKDTDFLWKNFKYIDVVESDHAPHTIEEKKSKNPPYGVPGLETTLPLLLTAVSEKRLTINDIIRLCHKNPAKILGVKTDKKTKIEIDINSLFIIHHSSLLTKCGWSPFEGFKVKGRVVRVYLRGTKVFENGKVLVKPGFGKIV